MLFLINSPMLNIPAIATNQTFILRATSGNLVCNVKFTNIFKQNAVEIYSKRSLNDSIQIPDAIIL